MTSDDAGSSSTGMGRRSPFRVAGRNVGLGTGRDAGRGASGAGQDLRPAPGRLSALLGSGVGGVAAAVFGTLLHGHVAHLGTVAVPVGALGALVLAGSLFLFCGLWARNIIMTAVAGAVAYGVVALLSTSSKTLILTGSSEAAPGPALAGNLWLFGVLVVTLAAVAVGAVVLRPVRRRRPGVSGPRGPF